MAKHGRGIAFVIVGAVVVAASAAALYLLVIAPKAQASKMKGEVSAFAERWDALRTCFYGTSARSDNAADAVMLRELTDSQLSTEIAVCEESLREARREEGPTTGIEKVESRWSEMNVARRDLAKALAIRLQVPPPRPVPELRRAVGEAAAKAEVAYAALREAAGLESDPLDGSPVVDAPLEPILVDGKPAAQVWVSNNRILAARYEDPGRLVAVLDGSGAPTVTRVGAGEDLAFGARWVVRVRGDALVAAELDPPAEGQAVREVEVSKSKDLATVVALDNGKAGRLIAARKKDAVVVFRSSDGGLTWKNEVLYGTGRPIIDSDPLVGRIVVSYNDSRYEIGGADLATARRPIYATPCFGESVSWWLTNAGLVAGGFDGPMAPVTGSEEMPWLANACTDRQALGVAPFDSDIDLPATKLRLCERGDCRISASLPRAHGATLRVAIGPLVGPIVAFAADGLALVWAGSKKGAGLEPRSWMRLPEGASLVGLLEWKGQIRAVIKTSSGRGGKPPVKSTTMAAGKASFALATFK